MSLEFERLAAKQEKEGQDLRVSPEALSQPRLRWQALRLAEMKLLERLLEELERVECVELEPQQSRSIPRGLPPTHRSSDTRSDLLPGHQQLATECRNERNCRNWDQS